MVGWRDARFLMLMLMLLSGVLLAYAAAIYDFNFDWLTVPLWQF